MQRLRHALVTARLILAWFALTLAAAALSPMVRAQTLELVCSAAGGAMLVAVSDDGVAAEAGANHTLDCPLCLPAALPWAIPHASVSQPQPLAHALQRAEVARIAELTGAPLPPRGPPLPT